jgi:hypothetical protein
VYNSSDDKLQNHKIYKDDTQTQHQLDNSTKWIMDINLNSILTDYLFSILKQYRTFEGVRNAMTSSNDIDFAIREYIKNNVINRYKLKNIVMYIKYRDIHNQNVLRYQNTWNPVINQTANILKKVQTETAYDYSTMKVMFTQEQPSSQYSFEYFFDLIFEKI